MKTKFLLIFLLFTAFVAKAQLIEVPFAKEAGIDIYTSDYEKLYHLFDNYSDFVKAQLFKETDSTYIMEIYYKTSEGVAKTEKKMTLAEVTDMRKSILNKKKELQKVQADRSGKLPFTVGNGLASLGGYGWMVPVMFGMTGKGAVATYMLTAAGGILVPMLLTRKTPISSADALLKNYGQLKGFGDAALLDAMYAPVLSSKQEIALFMGTSVLEATGGYFWSYLTSMSYEQAFTTLNYGLYGYLYGFNIGVLSVVDKDDFNKFGFFTPIVVGNFVGSAGGYFLHDKLNLTTGDNYLLFGTTLISYEWFGLAIAFTGDKLQDMQKPGHYIASLALAASTIGIGTGTYLGYKYDISGGQATIVNLATVGAGLLAGGLTFLTLPDSLTTGSFQILSGAIAASSTAAFVFLYRHYLKKNASGDLAMSVGNKLNFSFNPTAYYLYKKGIFDVKGGVQQGRSYPYMPAFSVSVRL